MNLRSIVWVNVINICQEKLFSADVFIYIIIFMFLCTLDNLSHRDRNICRCYGFVSYYDTFKQHNFQLSKIY